MKDRSGFTSLLIFCLMTAFLINEQNMQQSKRFRDTIYIYVWSLKPNYYKLSSKNYLQALAIINR